MTGVPLCAEMMLNPARSAAMANRIRELVEDGLANKGVSARRASMDVVGHDGLIRDIRAGRMPSFDRLIALFEYLSVPVSFGPAPGQKLFGMAEDAPSQSSTSYEQPAAGQAGAMLPFPWHPASGRRGMAPVGLSAAWLTENELRPEHLSVVIAPWEGRDRFALLDCEAARDGSNHIWGLIEAGQVALARITWQDPEMIVISWGDARPARAFAAKASEPRLLGRLVWMGDAILRG